VVCGKEFKAPLRSNAKTCSAECKEKLRLKNRAKNAAGKPPALSEKVCAECGKAFKGRTSQVVCSEACRAAREAKQTADRIAKIKARNEELGR
jgi:predicted nucleic acid-binding Zn ribbon protein